MLVLSLLCHIDLIMFVLFCNYTATTDIYTYGHTLSLHDALPICSASLRVAPRIRSISSEAYSRMPSSNRRTRRGNAAAASVAGGLLAALPGGVADADMRCSWLNAPNAQSKHVRGSGHAFPALATPYFWCGRRLVRFDDRSDM